MTIHVALSVALVRLVFGQTQPVATEILRKVTETYTHASEWDLAGTVTTTIAGPGETITVSTRLRNAGKGVAKRRSENEVVGMEGATIIVVDGENLWSYSSTYNQFIKKPLSQEPAEILEHLKAAIFLYQTGPNEWRDAQFLREETIEIGGRTSNCVVVQFHRFQPGSYLPLHTWWIDKNKFVVLRDDRVGALDPKFTRSSTIWTIVNITGSISDDLFTFTPPPGAREVERLGP